MRSKLFFTLVALIFQIFLVFPFSVYAKEYLQNLGFDQNLDHWQSNHSSITAESVSNEHRNGEASAKVSNTKTSAYGIAQLITDIKEDQEYRVQGWVKLGNELAHKAKIRIAWYVNPDKSEGQIDTLDTDEISDGADWTQTSKVIKVPKDKNIKAAEIRLVLASKNEGSEAIAYFDDISFSDLELTPTPEPTSIPTETPTPTSIPTPIPTVQPTNTTKPTAKQMPTTDKIPTETHTVSGKTDETRENSGSPTAINQLRQQILGEEIKAESSISAQAELESPDFRKPDFISIGLIGSGSLLLIGSAFPLAKKFFKKSQPISTRDFV
jgi:hypothetical protein